MKALFIGTDQPAKIIEVQGFAGVSNILGTMDFVNLGGDLLLAVPDMGIPDKLPFNETASRIALEVGSKMVYLVGDAIVFMDDESDVPLDRFPWWIQNKLSA